MAVIGTAGEQVEDRRPADSSRGVLSQTVLDQAELRPRFARLLAQTRAGWRIRCRCGLPMRQRHLLQRPRHAPGGHVEGGGLPFTKAFLLSEFDRHFAKILCIGAVSVINQDDIAEGNRNVTQARTIRRGTQGRKAEWKRQGISRMPFNIEQRCWTCLVGIPRTTAVTIVAGALQEQRIECRRYASQAYRPATFRIGVGLDAAARAAHLAEHEYVAGMQIQQTRVAIAGPVISKCRARRAARQAAVVAAPVVERDAVVRVAPAENSIVAVRHRLEGNGGKCVDCFGQSRAEYRR